MRSAIALQTWLPNSHILHDEILKLLANALLPTEILDRANLLFVLRLSFGLLVSAGIDMQGTRVLTVLLPLSPDSLFRMEKRLKEDSSIFIS